ncbi:uncharacterized protein GGS22DRAFT_199562 [Annulohypoxylon maeteangense]|uniref:uncharacterized protein n=1 Tax=Annulohypoxylon maeteangense TaxID=1927788 RepID=UPI00200820A1|nr:uncharacterized protein GGS22DRAFT_199562 [Annulohypoxylon maeteangense]KAI0886275.1 hypothetical protein GGS22DRAFT_199562 [Annulohypoxylon maeteangense]
MNLLAWISPKGNGYGLLHGDDDSKGSSTHTSTRRSFRDLSLKTALVGLLILSSFFAGRLSTSVPNTERTKTFGLEMKDQLFEYNRTFGETPSDATNAAWRSLFPQHGGFFVHPELAQKRSAFSVFHQLHCLDELRHGFYVLHDQVLSYSEMISSHQVGNRSDWAKQGKRALQEHSLGHIRHCIDLLRQSLMCNADLVIELKNEELGGVTGFGTMHRCVDWPGLLEWIRPYEGIDAPLTPQKHDHTG